jgi:tRNA (guanine-N7-)-methyltransferase
VNERETSTTSGPARPHHKFTADGNRMREVLSYSRRGSRLSAKQQAAWDSGQHLVLSEHLFDACESPHWTTLFGREGDLIVEIGSGIGEATVATATSHPEANVLALEVWRPGVAAGLARVVAAGVSNVRFCMVDAIWLFAERFEVSSVSELHTFFPDPWHKKRHHKRRLITASFGEVVTNRLQVGARWRIATDWADYANHIEHELAQVPALVGGRTARWPGRPLTKFERRGIAAGREIQDFTYHKRD